MNTDKNTNQTLRSGAGNTRHTPSIAKLQQILGTSPACRMLTPYEIELLRKSKQEIDQVVGQVLSGKRDT